MVLLLLRKPYALKDICASQPCPKRYPGRLQNTIEKHSKFYDVVEDINQELMKAESAEYACLL